MLPDEQNTSGIRGTAKRLDHLTALRFFAALMVFVVHMSFFLPSSWPLDNLAIGVSFFFILSGFVLTWSARTNDPPTVFFRRRFARIFPVYLLTWCFGVLLVISAHGALDAKTLGVTLFLGQAWLPQHQFYFRINLVAWSLSCEAFFYLCFPFVLAVLRRLSAGARMVLTGTCLVVTCLVVPLIGQRLHPTSLANWFVYICPATRFFEFLLGMLIGLAMRGGWRIRLAPGWAGAIVAVAVVATFHVPWVFRKEAVTVIPLALLIVCVTTAQLDGAASPLSRRWLVRLGEWSFAFYMIHALLYQGAARILPTHPPLAVGFAIDGGVLLLALASSWLIYTWYEMPLERRLKLPRSRLVPAASGEGSRVPSTALVAAPAPPSGLERAGRDPAVDPPLGAAADHHGTSPDDTAVLDDGARRKNASSAQPHAVSDHNRKGLGGTVDGAIVEVDGVM